MKRTSVKQIPPSTLRTQLAQSVAAGPHPDADHLTAFREDALLDRERAGILAHLAACPDCRTIVHTAAAAEPEPEPQIEPLPTRLPIRTWLPSVALAASLLVMAASTVVFYRTLRANPPRTSTVATAPQLPAAPAAASASQISGATNASPAPATPAEPKRPRTASRPAPLTPAQTEEAHIGAAPPPPIPPAAGISSSSSLGDVAQQAQNTPSPADEAPLQAELRAQSAYHGTMMEKKAAPPAAPSASQSVQVESGAGFAGSLKTTHSAVGGLIATPVLRPHFRITDSGQLERSTELGAWIQVPIAPDAHFRVISISGADVWAGGDHLRLFHSSDNGVNWIELQLPATADRAHAIAHIRIDTPQKLTVEDDAGATFTTTDAGVTWR